MADSKGNCVMSDQYNRIQGAVIKTQQKNYSVYKGVNTIGRNKNAIINLKNLNVSQNHAVIIIVDDTQHFISDLNSSNGTYLVGAKLSPYKLYELVNDVQITFGDVPVFYSRVANTDTTIHLQMECNDMTQNMTQNFYEAGTQLMINESSLNWTSLNNKTQTCGSDVVPDKDINRGPTQPSTSLAALRQKMSIHDEPTQVVDLPQDIEKLTEEINIHEMATQVVDLSQELKKLKEQEMNIHEMPTQTVDLPRDLNSLVEKCQDVSLHEMPSQIVSMPQGLELSEKSSDSSTQLNEDIHKSDHLVREETNTDAESNELFIQNTSNMCAIEETVIEETVIDETHLEKDEDSNDSINFLAINKPVTNEHAMCNKEAKSAHDNDSLLSDSQDIVKFRKRPVRKLSSSEDFTQSHNNKPICNSDSDTDIDNEIDVHTKITHKNLPTKEADVSGSETEIEDDLPEQFKNKSKILNSDSETDMEEHLSYNEILTQSQNIKPKILNKKRVLESDSETDIENDMQNDVELSQSQNIIKPKILNKKRTLDSDSETDIENDKENSVDLKQDHNESTTGSLNDTDCIPPTQDDFADMFAYKNPQISTANMNSQNESSEESFKLGLTELMVESIENKNEENALEVDKTNYAQGSADVVDDHNDQQLKNNEELNFSKGDDKEASIPKVIENKTGEDVYMAPTQKISTDSSKEEGNQQYAHVETMGADQSNTSIILNPVKETAPTEDDFYMMPTQKLYENNQATTSPISKKLDKEADDDFYMMPTQKHNQNNNQPEFKTPRKKYNFRKKEVKLDESLSSIFSKNPDDLYSAPTQKISEEEDKAEDIYLQPTQKLNEEKKQSDLYLQPSQDLNLIAAHKDEDFYMAPTQQMNINVENNTAQDKTKSDSSLQDNQHIPPTIGTASVITEKSHEDLYMAATQPINSGLTKSVTDSDLYLQETQDLGLTKNIESSKNKIESITIEERNRIEDKNENHQDRSSSNLQTFHNTEKEEDPYSAMTQPINPNLVDKTVTKVPVNATAQLIDSGPSNLVTDLYLQETEDLGLTKNIESRKNEIENITIHERNKIGNKDKNHHDRLSSNLQTSHDTEKQEDTYSAMTQPISPNLVDKTVTRVPVNTTAQPINSGSSKSVTDLYLQETQDLGLTKNIDLSKNKTKKNITFQERNKIEDKDENHHDRLSSNLQTSHDTEKLEDPYSAMTQPINPNLIDKTVTKIPDNTTAQPINSGPSKSITDLYLQETQDLSLTKNIESSKNKTKKNIKIQGKNKIEDKTIHETEKHDEDPYLAMTQPINPNLVNKSVAKIPINKSVTDIYLQETEDMSLIKKLDGNKNDKNDPYMMPTQHIIQEDSSFNKVLKTVQSDVVEEKISSGTKQHIQPNMNTSKLNKKRKLTDAETEKSSDSDTFIKKPLPTLRKTRKSEAGPSVETSKEKTVVDDSETLSQIQRFVVETSNVSKKAKVKTLPKKRSSAEAQIDVQSETLSQIEAFIKKPLNTITEDPQENIKTPSKRQKKEKAPDKIEPVNEDFQKPETSTRSRRSKSTIQPKTHVSKEECEAFDKSDSDVSTSSNRSDKSFALLEAKSTKTRKSQRLVNPVEVKVTVCKNRRSMATSAVSESSSSGSSVQSPTVFTSPEKGKRKQKPKVVFTMLDNPLLESLIRQLGGSVVDSVESSTVLVTEQVKRSQKLLTAVGQGKPICSPEWIRASKKANEFLDPWNYILLDKEAESKWNFSVRASLMRASNTKLLSNYTFLVIVNNAEDVLKGAIKACGGKCVPRCPAKNVDENFVVIASPENKSKYLKIRKQHPQVIIVEPEAIFDGVLRQELRLDKHIVV